MNISKLIAAALLITLSVTLDPARAADGPSPEQNAASVPVVEAPARPDSVKLSSVLERFRTYAGARTPSALSELFKAPVSADFRQHPEIALSSGAVLINIAATLPPAINSAPNFAFNGARLISSAQITSDQWLIEALPETGAWKAEMIVLMDSYAMEVPLVIVPPLPAETDLSEKGFIAFLGGREPAAKPLQDLNGDGRRDYLDDYIFTANYLLREYTGAPETSGEVPAPPDEPMADQGVGFQAPPVSPDNQTQGPATAQGVVKQGPVGAQTGNPVSSKNSGTSAVPAYDPKTYNTLTYDQKKKLREELARKNRINIIPQEPQPRE